MTKKPTFLIAALLGGGPIAAGCGFIETAEADLADLAADPASLGPGTFAATDTAADEAGSTDCVG